MRNKIKQFLAIAKTFSIASIREEEDEDGKSLGTSSDGFACLRFTSLVYRVQFLMKKFQEEKESFLLT